MKTKRYGFTNTTRGVVVAKNKEEAKKIVSNYFGKILGLKEEKGFSLVKKRISEHSLVLTFMFGLNLLFSGKWAVVAGYTTGLGILILIESIIFSKRKR